MQREGEINDLLNEVLTAELTSVNQYFVDSKMLDNWGYDVLAQHYRDKAQEAVTASDPRTAISSFPMSRPTLTPFASACRGSRR